jgi:predicted phosphoribosyltransferase
MIFKDRKDAGQKLAGALRNYLGQEVIVYALPRGGAVLGYYVAQYLNAPLDLIITRKVGHPSNPEYAICAVAEDGHKICNEKESERVDRNWLLDKIKTEVAEAKRRRKYYLGGHSVAAKNKIAILVDDGAATGLTFLLAVSELKHQNPKKIIAALPVAAKEAADKIRAAVDELVILELPAQFMGAVGAYYQRFDQVTDDEVVAIMRQFT